MIFTIPGAEEPTDEYLKSFFDGIQAEVNDNLHIKIDGKSKPFPLTASMGYAVMRSGDRKTAAQLLREADDDEREKKKHSKS